jgi:putative membrane protein
MKSLAIVGIVLLAVSIARTAERGENTKVEESALDILKKRYARGEINKDEYEEKKRDIS